MRPATKGDVKMGLGLLGTLFALPFDLVCPTKDAVLRTSIYAAENLTKPTDALTLNLKELIEINLCS